VGDNARGRYEVQINRVADSVDQLSNLGEAVAACQELRCVLAQISRGITPGKFVDPHKNHEEWKIALEKGVQCALTAIDNALITAFQVEQIETGLRVPLAIARYTLSQTTDML